MVSEPSHVCVLRMSGSQAVRTYLYVPGPHVVFVPLQGEVSVLLAHKSHQRLSVPPALGIQTKRCASPLERTEQGAGERERERKKIQSGEDDTQPMIPLGLLSKTEIGENPLGNIESFEKSCNILIRRLPWQTPGSDHRVVVNKFHLAAVDQAKPQVA